MKYATLPRAFLSKCFSESVARIPPDAARSRGRKARIDALRFHRFPFAEDIFSLSLSLSRNLLLFDSPSRVTKISSAFRKWGDPKINIFYATIEIRYCRNTGLK